MATRDTTRTPFGQRVYEARLHAGLSQGALGEKVGLRQSSVGEAETTANGSAKTVQIALECGVDPVWLATGQGKMLTTAGSVQEPIAVYAAAAPVPLSPPPNAYQMVSGMGEILSGSSHLTRLSIAPLLHRLAEYPEERESIARVVQRILSDEGNPAAPESSSSRTGADSHPPRKAHSGG